jgi:hypothetical protein
MGHEYKQVRYRAAEGRFDGELNRMADAGWKAESIDRVDDLFLVTYSREYSEDLKTAVCEARDLNRLLEENRDNRLISLTSLSKIAGSGTTGESNFAGVFGSSSTNTEFWFALVWAVSSPAERESRKKFRDSREARARKERLRDVIDHASSHAPQGRRDPFDGMREQLGL